MIEANFTCGPNSISGQSQFIGEDVRSVKVLRHIDLPVPATLYALKDGRYAKAIVRFGGMTTTIVIYATHAEMQAALDKTCIYDPETGRLWK